MINNTLHSGKIQRDKNVAIEMVEVRDLESASDGSEMLMDVGGSRSKVKKLRGKRVGPFQSTYELEDLTDATIDYIVPMPQPLPSIEDDEEFSTVDVTTGKKVMFSRDRQDKMTLDDIADFYKGVCRKHGVSSGGSVDIALKLGLDTIQSIVVKNTSEPDWHSAPPKHQQGSPLHLYPIMRTLQLRS